MENEKTTENKPAGKEKGKLFDWVDAFVKLVIAGVGIYVSFLGYQFQQSFATSQLLMQQQKADTDIRAQMFGKITDRLMKPSQKDGESLVQDALLAQVLALNFYELIELKPLMIDLDDQLCSEIEKMEKAGTNTPDLEVKKKAQKNLRWVARQIRNRQVSALICNPRNTQPTSFNVDKDGSIQYISVLRKGPKDRNPCEVSEKPGQNGCLGELMELAEPIKGKAIYIAISSADWKTERFMVILNLGKPKEEIMLPIGIKEWKVELDQDCRDELKPKKGDISQIYPGFKSFEVTWFDFPFTDNTLLADGSRYAIFIDEISKDPEDEPNAIRLGLLYFPKDYYPSRERPVRYKEFSEKLGLKNSN